MTRARQTTVALGLLAGVLIAGCGPKRIAGPSRPGRDVVVLLPEPEPGSLSAATVSNQRGAVNLDAERDATVVTTSRPPSTPATMSESEVQQIFGDAIAGLPPPPGHFTLFFQFESDELTDQARALIPDVLAAVRGRAAPDVVAIGHTDTTGTAASNVDLGLKRALAIQNLLVAAGLEASAIEVASHGEADLLVATPDERYEPRNRRVEITVR